METKARRLTRRGYQDHIDTMVELIREPQFQPSSNYECLLKLRVENCMSRPMEELPRLINSPDRNVKILVEYRLKHGI